MRKLLLSAVVALLCAGSSMAQNRPIPTSLIVWDSVGDHYMSIVPPTNLTANDTLKFPQLSSNSNLLVSNSTGGQTVTGGLTVDDLNITNLLELNGSAGTSGQVLTSQGPSSPPIWTTVNSGNGKVSGKDTSVTISSGGTYTIGTNDYVIVITGSANDQTVDLPSASGNAGRMLIVESKNNSHSVTLTPSGSDTIGGQSGNYSIDHDGSSFVFLVSDGTGNWLILASSN